MHVRKLALPLLPQLGLEPTTRSPRLINDEDPEKGVAAAEKMLEEAGTPVTDENVFIAATCGEKGIAFLKGKARENIRKVRAEKVRDLLEEHEIPRSRMVVKNYGPNQPVASNDDPEGRQQNRRVVLVVLT